MKHIRRLLPFRTAARLLLALFAAAIGLQLIVLAGWIPDEMVWGGRLLSRTERTLGAIVAILVLGLAAFLVRMRMGRFGARAQERSRYGLWFLAAVFVLNTLGNLAAEDLRETLIFTPITLLAALLAWRVAVGEGQSPSA